MNNEFFILCNLCSFAPDGKRDDANGVFEKDEKFKEPEGDYDPYQERVVDHPTTYVFFFSCTSLLKNLAKMLIFFPPL